jgi:hypothetical protein
VKRRPFEFIISPLRLPRSRWGPCGVHSCPRRRCVLALVGHGACAACCASTLQPAAMEGKGSDDDDGGDRRPRPSPRGSPVAASAPTAAGGSLLARGVGLVSSVLSTLLSPLDRIVGGGQAPPASGAVRGGGVGPLGGRDVWEGVQEGLGWLLSPCRCHVCSTAGCLPCRHGQGPGVTHSVPDVGCRVGRLRTRLAFGCRACPDADVTLPSVCPLARFVAAGWGPTLFIGPCVKAP